MMTTQDVVCSAMVTLLSNITIFYTFCIQAGFQVDFFFLFLTEFCHSSSSTCNLFQDHKEPLGDVGAHSGQLVSPSQVCTYTISTVSYECTINPVLNLHVLDCGKKSEYILKKTCGQKMIRLSVVQFIKQITRKDYLRCSKEVSLGLSQFQKMNHREAVD